MDQPSKIVSIVVLILLIFLSGFFSAAETALMAITKLKLRSMEERGEKGVSSLEKLTNDPSKLLTAILIGNNIVNIAATSIASALFIDLFGASGVALATFIMTILVLIFGEITPKSIAQNNPEKLSLKIVKPMSIITYILSPLATILGFVKKITFILLRIPQEQDQPTITEEELKTMINISHEEGVLEMEEKDIIHNIFEFADTKAKEIMINRLDIVGISKKASYDEAISLFKEDKFSRLPVYEENLDSIIGILNIKDIIFLTEKEIEAFDITNYMREALFTYEFKSSAQLLEDMKQEKTQIVIVVDEYGATSGLITLEDLLEQVVGDLEDEYHGNDDTTIKVSDNEFIVDASASLSNINDLLGTSLESDNFDSIGGYIIGHIESIPQSNTDIDLEDLKITIEDSDKMRINKIRIKKGKQPIKCLNI